MVTQSREIGLMFTHRHWAAIFITPDKGSSTTNNYDDSRWGSPKSQPISGEKWVNMVSRNMSKYVDLDFEMTWFSVVWGHKKDVGWLLVDLDRLEKNMLMGWENIMYTTT